MPALRRRTYQYQTPSAISPPPSRDSPTRLTRLRPPACLEAAGEATGEAAGEAAGRTSGASSSVARRAGDVAECYADASLAEKMLGWRAEHSLDDMCRDAWKWQSTNPHGYREEGVQLGERVS